MGPVGHSLVGISFAWIATSAPNQPITIRSKIALYGVMVAVASLPDWPLPSWGHDRYDISHSIFVNVALILTALTVRQIVGALRRRVSWRWSCLLAGAWLSHLLLDSFYSHNRGVAIYWPLSKARLNFSMPWFHNLDLSLPIFSQHNLSVCGVEFLFYGLVFSVVFAVVTLWRRWTA